ncbi:siderophore ABC transporter substrate-binding protein [Yoonia maritima]|uniref:siderophore ABC transporter substrate-binding protein n=1 Tax=Yoonia maritima TaxID=1435347 RepID=UPI000D10393C|nr:siderophore ABC transporter substrate-binding protein [Yoonia maritima]
MFERSIFGAAFAALVATSGFADTSLTTPDGVVSLAETPETVITFDVGALDTLTALGVDVAGLTEPLYVPALAALDDGTKPKIGSLFEPDFEQVFAIQPDLIIVGPRSASQMEALSDIAQTVNLSPFSDDLEQVVVTQTTELGALFGKEAEAEALVGELHSSLVELRGLTENAGKGLIVMTNGPKISVFGPESRFGWVHATLGVAPVLENVEAETHGEAISFEFLHDANPDWMIVFDRTSATGGDGPSANETLDNELVAQTTAMQTGQVIYVNPADFYIATSGVRSLQDTVNQFIEAYSANQ